MKSVFADTVYWIAVTRPGDQWTGAAKSAREAFGPALLVTTDEVLAEFLAALSGGGEAIRQLAVDAVRAMHSNPNVKVIAQSRDTFLRALER